MQSLSSPQKMDRTQICFYLHKYRHVIIYCLIILFAASTSIFNNRVFMAEGRAISKLIEVAPVQNQPHKKGMKERRLDIVVNSEIGSRPPKCEGRCRSCGHCEAVQVPVEEIVQRHRSHYSSTRAIFTYSSRSDDLSNYKPISWKCKCGDYFFNP
ncbi:PREDICTED: EPIDERMAL PATTERNING FACTOR-like protein 2 isoform X2 [Lupinus angustifolius]|uniref:EPIDERMAL PATTERNING FACTOR-like protein 2 isoform X2 n=1 Tax=Lupinus angustifolius TaxID=3871 RepID=UPI00092E90B9|nr:PREDICTED: EPIDERMAL PATTERNING FACTOR-like protein 2 isoform X2 [Lupinus angustifolius]